MAVIAIPDPALVVLVGPAGSGKSTFATRHFGSSEILSSDAFRALVSGDEADQGATRAAFGRLHRELARRLAEGRLTVVDATNVERAARRGLLIRARVAGVPAIAIVLDLPPAIVRSRNASRAGRVVEASVVGRHLARLRATLDRGDDSLRSEGFAQVVVLHDLLDLDAVRIVRTRRG